MARLLWIAFDGSDAPAGAAFAKALGVGFDLLQITGQPAIDVGAEKVLSAALDEVPPADGLAKALVATAGGYSHIGAVSAMRSKDVLARLAGLLDAAMVTDVTGV